MTPATVEEATAGLRRAAWRGELFRDPLVHSVMGFGADWDLPGAIRAVETARELVWLEKTERPLGYRDHGLGVVDADGRRVFLQAERDGDPLPDPPPPDSTALDVGRLLSHLHGEVTDQARRSGGSDAPTVSEWEVGGQGSGHEFGWFAVAWRGRQVVVAVTAAAPEAGDGGGGIPPSDRESEGGRAPSGPTAVPLLAAWDLFAASADYRGNGPTFTAADVRRFLRENTESGR